MMRKRSTKPVPPLGTACCVLAAAALLGAGWQIFWKPDPDVAEGNQLLRQNKAKKALDAYVKAEKRLGRRHRLDYNLGLAHYGLGNYKKARESFLSSSGATDEGLRRHALYNFANTLFKLAEPTLEPATKARQAARAAEERVSQLSGPEKVKERCLAMQAALKAYEGATKANQAVIGAFKSAYQEYRMVLVRSPSFFKAKWNLELALRHMGGAKAANSRLAAKQKALAERFKKECESKDDQNKKDQDKKDQDKKDQDKKDQDKKDQNNTDQNKKDQGKKDQDKKDQDKKDQDKKDQNNTDQNKKQDQQKQKPLTKEDIAKERAARELDKLERRQRDRDRQRTRSGSSRQPFKDW